MASAINNSQISPSSCKKKPSIPPSTPNTNLDEKCVPQSSIISQTTSLIAQSDNKKRDDESRKSSSASVVSEMTEQSLAQTTTPTKVATPAPANPKPQRKKQESSRSEPVFGPQHHSTASFRIPIEIGITNYISDPPPSFSNHLSTPHGVLYGDRTHLSTTSTKVAASDSKYQTYHLLVDSTQEDRAVEIALFTAKRPHMRAFHFAWMSFFVAFFNWFAISPLLSEVAMSLDLTKKQIWTSSICAVAGTAVVRAAIGPFCDKYGSRMCTVVTLVVSGIPALVLGFVRNAVGLSVLRLVIGVGGATFVTGQYWTSSMFTREVAGTANALVAGWGNLGGGVTQVVMGSILFPLFKWMFRSVGVTQADDDMNRQLGEKTVEELAWRTVMIVPGILSLITAYLVFKYSDDSPKGNYSKRTRTGQMSDVSAVEALKTSLRECNTWLLFLQYACCFGVEITMSNAAALYFKYEFDMSTEKAAAIASIFGWMNLFARGFGGFVSDISNAWKGMRGRLVWHSATLLLEGVTVIIFASTKTLAGAICTMCVFSIFVQAAEGSTYGIVPYVKPRVTGSIAGLVGAGGTIGGVIFSILFREYDYRKAFFMMGYTVICSALLSGAILIPGHKGCLCGKDAEEVRTKSRMNQLQDHSSENQPDIEDNVSPCDVQHTSQRISSEASQPDIPMNVSFEVNEFSDDMQISNITEKEVHDYSDEMQISYISNLTLNGEYTSQAETSCKELFDFYPTHKQDVLLINSSNDLSKSGADYVQFKNKENEKNINENALSIDPELAISDDTPIMHQSDLTDKPFKNTKSHTNSKKSQHQNYNIRKEIINQDSDGATKISNNDVPIAATDNSCQQNK